MFFRLPLFKCESLRHAVVSKKLADMTSWLNPFKWNSSKKTAQQWVQEQNSFAPVFLYLRSVLFYVFLSIFPGIKCAGFDCKSKRDDKAGLPNAKVSDSENKCQMKWVSFCPSCTDRTCIEKGSFRFCLLHFPLPTFKRAILVDGQQRHLIKGFFPVSHRRSRKV